MSRWIATILVASFVAVSVSPAVSAQISQPDIIQEHWYHSYATLTLDLNAWADEHPDIVNLLVVGQTELGRNLWMLQISDWSMDSKPDGTAKEVVYIDGGHHGNEHLGTELAFLTAEYYIEGWGDGEQDVIDILSTTELHILIMLNADGNDFDTRWNVNQVDLNRNYDHYWNTCPTTQPGSSAFSESETLANSIYMNEVVPDADLYITMHTGVWIMLYPWGKWPEQPSDWEMYHHIRDEVNSNISDIPIRNANQGLYPNCGTSRDYGYGVMGYPTFTFETDDEQFLLGTVEALSERLAEELDVMMYLIENVWYWRARLFIDTMVIDGEGEAYLEVSNHGRASTTNATLGYVTEERTWFPIGENPEESPCEMGDLGFNYSSPGCGFGVNATNSTEVILDFGNAPISNGQGSFHLFYQKRVIDASGWVSEPINDSIIQNRKGSNMALSSPSVFLSIACFFLAALGKRGIRVETI
ncbi:MAG: M14 family metallopeptidase [Candidatus Thalassarchaeaceae archaeon]